MGNSLIYKDIGFSYPGFGAEIHHLVPTPSHSQVNRVITYFVYNLEAYIMCLGVFCSKGLMFLS